MLALTIGQKVAYPNQGVCVVEARKEFDDGTQVLSGFSLRLLCDNSTIFVPDATVDTLGIRPLINTKQCRQLLEQLGDDFEELSSDWKTRSKDFIDKVRSGNVFEVADVLKKLSFLSRSKKLSFREQTLMEKARFLVVSELSNARVAIGKQVGDVVDQLVETACSKHGNAGGCSLSASTH
ncbi:MAG: hypothetical protein IT172_06040 [Acidobacteria bacterium]|nr:hypothetical protein [Acidobacteriota bacterium]